MKAKRATVVNDGSGSENGQPHRGDGGKKGGKTTKKKMTMATTPKKKSMNSFSDSFEVDSDDEFQPEGRYSKGDGTKKRGRPPLPLSRSSDCSTSKGRNRAIIVLSDDESEGSGLCDESLPGSTCKKRSRPFDQKHDSDSDGDDVAPNEATLFNVHTFSEWPGQAEGEPMDLPHIWNVISMMFPEDYSKEVSLLFLFFFTNFSQWIDFMLSVFKNGSTNAFLPQGESTADDLLSIPPLGNWESTLEVKPLHLDLTFSSLFLISYLSSLFGRNWLATMRILSIHLRLLKEISLLLWIQIDQKISRKWIAILMHSAKSFLPWRMEFTL